MRLLQPLRKFLALVYSTDKSTGDRALQFMFNLILLMFFLGNVTVMLVIANSMREIRSNVVLDIDSIRNQHYTEMRFAFVRGCLKGVDYNGAYDSTEYNPNSPSTYCDNMAKEMDEYFVQHAAEIGKPSKQKMEYWP